MFIIAVQLITYMGNMKLGTDHSYQSGLHGPTTQHQDSLVCTENRVTYYCGKVYTRCNVYTAFQIMNIENASDLLDCLASIN